MFSIDDNRLKVLFMYTYEMSRNISPAEGGRIAAGGGEIPDVYREAINALEENKKISEYFKESGVNNFFKELIAPNISVQIEKMSDKETYIKAVLLQYSADLAHYFKQTSHFVKPNYSLEKLQTYKNRIKQMSNTNFGEFYQRFSYLFDNSLEPFDQPEDEKLFRTELDMDIKDFYHNTSLIILGKPLLPATDDKLMEPTYKKIESAIKDFEQGLDINNDGIFISYGGNKK